MRKLAYEKLAAFAKLDTQSAHDTMAAIDRLDDLLPIGDARCVAIGNTGYTLTLLRT
jgi:hypothetical protein